MSWGEDQGVKAEAMLWRQEGRWRLMLTAPAWLIEDLAVEMKDATLKMSSWGGGVDVPQRVLLFRQAQVDEAKVSDDASDSDSAERQ